MTDLPLAVAAPLLHPQRGGVFTAGRPCPRSSAPVRPVNSPAVAGKTSCAD